MEQHIDDLVRSRLRAIRQHLGWSLDELAERSGVGASTISRIETGNRTISFDVLVPLARELDVAIDDLVSSDVVEDVVIRPEAQHWPGMTTWCLSKPGSSVQAVKMRLEPDAPRREPRVHPGHDFMFVIDGTVELTLGARTLVVGTGESAEFSTMVPHHVGAVDGPAEVVMIFDRDGAAVHLDD